MLNQAFLFCYIFCVEFTFFVCWTPLPISFTTYTTANHMWALPCTHWQRRTYPRPHTANGQSACQAHGPGKSATAGSAPPATASTSRHSNTWPQPPWSPHAHPSHPSLGDSTTQNTPRPTQRHSPKPPTWPNEHTTFASTLGQHTCHQMKSL